ncbi:MAG: hypothetical protein IPK46_06225 [Saprospiraceae bacterium]|nr:hypothetical protein [Saprospiraceae bacterium]
MFLNSNLRDPKCLHQSGSGPLVCEKPSTSPPLRWLPLRPQVGSGIIYWAYEQRPLFIDNALLGASLKYQFSDAPYSWAFGGQQKNALTFIPAA